MENSFYPKSPEMLPGNLKKLPGSYYLRAWLAVFSVFLFFILYFALVAGTAYLVYLALIFEMVEINKFTILMKLGAIAGSAMLFVFTLKFIFKLKNIKPDNRKKVNLKENPELKDFVLRVCKETGAPRPKSVYVDPDVNAYVAYTNIWLSLLFPTRKDLTIGLGIIDCLNLSEFKAVVAHEFGHFAQRSMKIGSYIISANTIIHDMIYTRDRWDEVLAQWRASDIRLSAAAWVITPIVWLIRSLLGLFYQFLNIMHSSLSREMEFNADKVAVSAAGSDSIISALWNLDRGADIWQETINHAYLAAQKDLYVSNLYLHNQIALQRNEKTMKTAFENLPKDKRGGKKYFSTSENSKVGMYASHPPNDHREDNAKTPYVFCEIDEKSPWNLFAEKTIIQEEVTLLFYEKYLVKKPAKFVETEKFEAFISAESKGKDLLKEYDNTFENRYLNIPEEAELISLSKNSNGGGVQRLDQLKLDLKKLMQPVQEIEKLMNKVQQIGQGITKEKSFTYKQVEYKRKNLQEGFDILFQEREKLFAETFKEWDKDFCALHYHLAHEQGKAEDLLDLYKQHQSIIKLYKEFVNIRHGIFKKINDLQSNDEVTESEVNRADQQIRDTIPVLNQLLEDLGNHKFVPLPNLKNVSELKNAIVPRGKFEIQAGKIFQHGRLDIFLNALEAAINHCQRIDQNSIKQILLFNKQVVESAQEELV